MFHTPLLNAHRVRHVLAVNGTDHWLQVLDTEFGGMNEALYNLYSLTQDPAHAGVGSGWASARGAMCMV